MSLAAPKLFMVLVGGHTPTSNLEVHDMRFVTGNTLQDTYETLQSEWWGAPDTLHIDGWARITQIDGFDISLSPEKYGGAEKLYFINLGGYVPDLFDEVHKNILVVEKSLPLARQKAKNAVADWKQPHKDTEFEIEKILPLAKVDGYHIHLSKAQNPVPFSFHCAYSPISKKALAKKALR